MTQVRGHRLRDKNRLPSRFFLFIEFLFSSSWFWRRRLLCALTVIHRSTPPRHLFFYSLAFLDFKFSTWLQFLFFLLFRASIQHLKRLLLNLSTLYGLPVFRRSRWQAAKCPCPASISVLLVRAGAYITVHNVRQCSFIPAIRKI